MTTLTIENGVLTLTTGGPANLYSPSMYLEDQYLITSAANLGRIANAAGWAAIGFIPMKPNTTYEVTPITVRREVYEYADPATAGQDSAEGTALVRYSRSDTTGQFTTRDIGGQVMGILLTNDYTQHPNLADEITVKEVGVTGTEVKILNMGSGATVRKGWSTNEVQIVTECGETLALLANFTYDGVEYTTQEAAVALLQSIL